MVQGKNVADDFLLLINSFNSDGKKDFIFTVANSHRTLQQSAMRLFVELAAAMAENGFDERNEAAVTLAKKITEMAKNHPLPFI